MHVRFVGADGDFIYFLAESASRKGLEHSVSVSKRDGIITCDCEDATYRQKFGDVMDLKSGHTCRHIRRLCHTLGAVLDTRGAGASPPNVGPRAPYVEER